MDPDEALKTARAALACYRDAQRDPLNDYAAANAQDPLGDGAVDRFVGLHRFGDCLVSEMA